MNRKETLAEAEKCICGQREHEYGSPEDNFETIGLLWGVYLRAKYPALKKVLAINGIRPDDVAIMMTQVKTARIASGQTKEDNYVDGAGYFACAAEIATKKLEVPETEEW